MPNAATPTEAEFDPRTGETTYRLTNINRSEPAPSLFEIPDDVRGKKLTRKPRPTKEEQ